MIATPGSTKPTCSRTSRNWQQARRRAAELLPDPDGGPPRRVPRWRGWLLVAWMMTVTICYLLVLAGRGG